MLDDVCRYVEATFESLNPSRARTLANQMVSGQPTEQVNRMAKELLDWSQRTRERITELVQHEVKRQLSAMGIATSDDLDSLKARIRQLERSRGGGRSSGQKSPARKRSPAKKSSARTSGPERSE